MFAIGVEGHFGRMCDRVTTKPLPKENVVKETRSSTFREILESSRQQAAASAWERARQASSLRHAAAARGDRRAADLLSHLKREAIRLAAFVLPEQVQVTIDGDSQIGLLSIRFQGRGRLHLPAASLPI